MTLRLDVGNLVKTLHSSLPYTSNMTHNAITNDMNEATQSQSNKCLSDDNIQQLPAKSIAVNIILNYNSMMP